MLLFLFSGQCTNVKWSSVSYITVNYEKRPLMIGTYRLSHEATYQLAHSISALQIMTKAKVAVNHFRQQLINVNNGWYIQWFNKIEYKMLFFFFMKMTNGRIVLKFPRTWLSRLDS